jgi:hypothetical protein
MKDDKLANIELDTIPNVKDPGKELIRTNRAGEADTIACSDPYRL